MSAPSFFRFGGAVAFLRPVFLLTFCFFLQACASAYKGPEPDFRQTGAAARAEADKFTLDESPHFEGRGSWFEMGNQKDWYTVSSLQPLIEQVSPEAGVIVRRAQVWRTAQWIVLGAAVAAGVAAATNEHRSSRDMIAFGALLAGGAGVAINFHYGSLLSSAAAQYNLDLRRSFTPSLGLNWNF